MLSGQLGKISVLRQYRTLVDIQTNSMRLTTIFCFFLLSTISLAQIKDLSTLPAYDCSLKKVMSIIGRQTGNRQLTTKTIFKKDFNDLVEGYKNWLDQQ